MTKEVKTPTMTKKESDSGSDRGETYEHDAFGTIALTIQTGGAGVLFGSDINHGQCVSIRICKK